MNAFKNDLHDLVARHVADYDALAARLAEAEETYRSEIRGLHETSNTLHRDRDRLQARLAEAEMQNKRMRYALQSIADDVYDPWTNGAQAQHIAISALAPSTPRFAKTFCSQCGGEFGPGDSGYSHCEDHRAAFSADVALPLISHPESKPERIPTSTVNGDSASGEQG